MPDIIKQKYARQTKNGPLALTDTGGGVELSGYGPNRYSPTLQSVQVPRQNAYGQPNAAGTTPAGTTPSWQDQLSSIMNQINNRKPFQYNMNADALYQNMKEQYVRQGKAAMQDTMAQAAALTGGYNSSYGQAVGQQAYDRYLQELNAQVPELYAQARAAYDADTDDLYRRLNAAQGMAQDEYNKERDRLADERYQQEYADQLAYQQWQQQRAEQEYADNQDYKRWQQQREEQEYADKMAYQRWQQSQAEADAASDAAYRQWQMSRSDSSDARDYALTMIKLGRMPSADVLEAAGMSAEDAQYMASYYSMMAAGYGSGGSGGSGSGSRGSGGSGGGSGSGSGSGSGDGDGNGSGTGKEIDDKTYTNLLAEALKNGESWLVSYMDKNYGDYTNKDDVMQRILSAIYASRGTKTDATMERYWNNLQIENSPKANKNRNY